MSDSYSKLLFAYLFEVSSAVVYRGKRRVLVSRKEACVEKATQNFQQWPRLPCDGQYFIPVSLLATCR